MSREQPTVSGSFQKLPGNIAWFHSINRRKQSCCVCASQTFNTDVNRNHWLPLLHPDNELDWRPACLLECNNPSTAEVLCSYSQSIMRHISTCRQSWLCFVKWELCVFLVCLHPTSLQSSAWWLYITHFPSSFLLPPTFLSLSSLICLHVPSLAWLWILSHPLSESSFPRCTIAPLHRTSKCVTSLLLASSMTNTRKHHQREFKFYPYE